MKKSIVLTLLICITFLVPLAAEDLTVDYIDGYLDLLDNGDWIELYPGDIVSSSDTIRLDEDSFADLSGRNKNLSLTQEGVYKVSNLLAGQAETSNMGLGSVVSGKLAIMLNNQQVETQSTVGGVRAAEAEGAPQLDWMESETIELIEEGKSYLEDGDYDEALSIFEEAWDLSMDDQEEGQALYYLGFTNAVAGKTGQALKYLMMVEPDPYMENYHNHFLLTGNLLLNTFAYDTADEWLSDYDAESAAYEAPETEQMIYLIWGMSLKMSGDNVGAEKMFNEVLSIDMESETAGKAWAALNSL
ncbi:MAG: tetratricopeptide repeat protein [Spirochaetales bacterium]|nr:tetratricopeptide repeat protein [Spirochaetales bacterium]